MRDTTTDPTTARDRRLAELMTEMLAPPDPAEAHAVRVQRTRDLVAEMEVLCPGAVDRLHSAAAALQLQRLARAGARPH